MYTQSVDIQNKVAVPAILNYITFCERNGYIHVYLNSIKGTGIDRISPAVLKTVQLF